MAHADHKYAGTVKGWVEVHGVGLIKPDGVPDCVIDILVQRDAFPPNTTVNVGDRVIFESAFSHIHKKYEATVCIVTGTSSNTLSQAHEPQPFGIIEPKTEKSTHKSCVLQEADTEIGRFEQQSLQRKKEEERRQQNDIHVSFLRFVNGFFGIESNENEIVENSRGQRVNYLPSENVFIANMPADCEERDVRKIFQEYGQVERVKMMWNAMQTEKAVLMEMGNIEQATWLVKNLHENIPLGLKMPITVRFADNRSEQKRKPVGPGRGGANGYLTPTFANVSPDDNIDNLVNFPLEVKMATHHNIDKLKIWVGSIPTCCTDRAIGVYFQEFGDVREVFCKDDGSLPGRKFGFVTFTRNHSSRDALEEHSHGGSLYDGAAQQKKMAQAMKETEGQGKSLPKRAWPDPKDGPKRKAALNQGVEVSLEPQSKTKLFVRFIPRNVNAEDIDRNFRDFGHVVDVILQEEPDRMDGRKQAYVIMFDEDSANHAIAGMSGKRIKVQA